MAGLLQLWNSLPADACLALSPLAFCHMAKAELFMPNLTNTQHSLAPWFYVAGFTFAFMVLMMNRFIYSHIFLYPVNSLGTA